MGGCNGLLVLGMGSCFECYKFSTGNVSGSGSLMIRAMSDLIVGILYPFLEQIQQKNEKEQMQYEWRPP